ncbi:unnamed protein product [Rotaria sp. Silwood1]|nr:unnamed protein product [Rotaria sp. Silwood1]CAF1074276.1 unnamed protein product [Rotaria sp. Silwood1]CAF1081080.1 unnamed protein product [Rotaria sp. Silwood1]CAF3412719.1 unnamed protein product [Rotaria sp. Silwood1]CAF3440167.1 unnamed protein product [Rotaria sp. Silwood1]
MPSIAFLNSVSLHISIYFGMFILICGLIGNLFNILVFLSLKIFRENSCAFYLTTMSLLNMGQLLSGVLPRIVNAWFATDWSDVSLAYCKFRAYCFQVCSLTSFTCMCIATIDQFLVTWANPRWQRYCNIQFAYRFFIISFLIWILHGIPTLVYETHTISILTNANHCEISDSIFQKYYNYGFVLVLTSSLPVFVTALFGSLAYRNVRLLAYRTVPLVRRELDKQLTLIVLVQVVFNSCVIVPYIITYMFDFSVSFTRNTIQYAVLQLARNISTNFFYLYFAVSRNNRVQILSIH